MIKKINLTRILFWFYFLLGITLVIAGTIENLGSPLNIDVIFGLFSLLVAVGFKDEETINDMREKIKKLENKK